MADKPVPQIYRKCARCLHEKLANTENFSFIKARGKFHSWCKACCAEKRREDRREKPEHYRRISAASVSRNREKVNARTRARYHENREANLAATRKRMEENRDIYNANRRAKRRANPEAAREAARTDRLKNIERYRGYARKYWAAADPKRKLRCNFTSAICHSLQGRTKGGRSWQTILGFSTSELRDHLERQFLSGMTWENYGDWHVDHILPVASFDFESADDPEFRACWALSNLRPLWAKDNLSKRHTRTHLI